MLKKLIRSLGSSEADINSSKNGLAGVDAPPLNESDYEFLFLQLLEGLAHGWQQPRIVSFFEDIENRISPQQWLEWLNGYGSRMLASGAPDNNLASRMVQLGEMRCGAIGDAAYDIGMKVLTRGQQSVYVDFDTDDLGSAGIDMFEFAGMDTLSGAAADLEIVSSDDPSISEFAGMNTLSGTAADLEIVSSDDPSISEFAGPDSMGNSTYISEHGDIEDISVNEAADSDKEVKEVSLAEFYEILQQDPELAQGISQELGLDRSDPELIIQALVAQAQSEEPQS